MVATGLPEGWTLRKSRTHNKDYYFKDSTKESVWEPPAGTDLDQLQKYLNQPKKVKASHLLIKHKDSRRPASWKSENITRTKEEAIEILKKHQERIKNGEATLGEIAKTESDCSSAKRNGDLGPFERGQMQPPFENATFDLEIGQISDIVETDSGVHLIERTG
ncbi:Peptidyl-prolyl cis-trans isomerase ssp-1 [Wickerhamomyces ciferrii]|uniref:Peptidyl-prolyl cis-trans isomerase n=1 Tax=Wickerhamomyces ciferrii (strain ATCC 14091 / BCRC 22168 / CBS 111 / JCM 3599 / NBRC 0793 / NRRL Y-1031 F-60-10) TaxID=1206466 RepID=K0KUN7_WICCF|nr:Peptidyl-prolyl cis-trans isomerase ssp-1 [Wickerhamomyces ciferrii]CCH45144.1 Peptidyl-prolyl cis-trans isomerase ssp-1 [Wickerhamomyces ciferrii]